ncbi:MAG: RNA polymerase-binding protein DksA [Deltaproteobacteria bacterium]|nr:RNA polymerase-binding protein DksA [Deltaproteobacteria bacterium]
MDKKEIERFKKLLTEQREEIMSTARATLAQDLGINVDDLPDEMDLASAEYDHAMNFRLRGREKTLLRKIDLALERIEDGEYGVCEECGDEISVRRLEARPVTTLCIGCKEEQERKEKEYV